MSYLDTRITTKEFIRTRGSSYTQKNTITALNLFDHFCNELYQKTGEQVVLDLEEAINQDGNYDRLYRLVNGYVQWLLEDHPNIKIQKHRHTETLKKHNPTTIRQLISTVRQYLEEFGRIEFSQRRFQRMVKLPKIIHQELEPFTKEEIRLFIDSASPKRKALYMTLKDSGMRIGEALQIQKKHIDITTNPVRIDIPAEYTKTKQSRITFVTRETKPYLVRLLAKLEDDELVFGTNTNIHQAVNSEEQLFARTRELVGLTQKYSHNNRFKKNPHSFRAFCATQLTEVFSEEFAHGFIGHKGYLTQYIRNKDKLAEKYLRAENNLMIYESIEVIDSDERVKKLEMENQSIRKDMMQLSEIMEEMAKIKTEKAKQELEIEFLKQQISN